MKTLYIMKPFDNELTDKNYATYAMKNYDNPQCLDMDEFMSDLNRIKYLKRLFRRYETTDEFKDRLILNHIIILYNVFGVVPGTRLLFHRMEEEFYPILKTCIVYLNLLPELDSVNEIVEADIISIPLDNEVVRILREV